WSVTGVQTCALPIWNGPCCRRDAAELERNGGGRLSGDFVWHDDVGLPGGAIDHGRGPAIEQHLRAVEAGGHFAGWIQSEARGVRRSGAEAEDGEDLAGSHRSGKLRCRIDDGTHK